MTKPSNMEGFPKFLKICSPKQAFKIWLDISGNNENGRIASDLFDMFGGSESKLYIDWLNNKEAREQTQ